MNRYLTSFWRRHTALRRLTLILLLVGIPLIAAPGEVVEALVVFLRELSWRFKDYPRVMRDFCGDVREAW